MMSETLQLVLFGLNVVATSICVVAAVISSQKAKLPPSSELQAHVDELGALVEKLLKEQRKERMSRVRHAGIDKADSPAPAEAIAPDNLHAIQGADLKAQLRARARAAGRI